MTEYRGHNGPVRVLAWEPGGARIASGGDDLTIRLWAARPAASTEGEAVTDPARAGRLGTLSGPAGAVTAVAFSADGATLAAASEDGKIRLWDSTDTAAAPLVLRSHAGGVTAVLFSPDSGQVASGGDTGSVVLEPTRTATLAALRLQPGRPGPHPPGVEGARRSGAALPPRLLAPHHLTPPPAGGQFSQSSCDSRDCGESHRSLPGPPS